MMLPAHWLLHLGSFWRYVAPGKSSQNRAPEAEPASTSATDTIPNAPGTRRPSPIRIHLVAGRSLLLCLALGMSHGFAQSDPNLPWQAEAESRLKAIFDGGEFRAQKFQAEWLPDSSGYTMEERDPNTKETTRITYRVRTGERLTTRTDPEKESPRERLLSPDGSRLLKFQDRNLFVKNLSSGQLTPLAKHASTRDISYHNPAWSPDGLRVVFVESDATDVRQRAVLDPSDPSHPGVEHHRFARVGETIERLRVGVVDADGRNLMWLPVLSPEEGFYLGQVEWAGNSEEVLIERFSRFRDRREFFLAKRDGSLELIFRDVNDAWVESSQGRNSGLTWIRGGRAFVVVSEKDGWRHAHLWSRAGQELAVLTPGRYDLIDRPTDRTR